jgi:hypothetical protein
MFKSLTGGNFIFVVVVLEIYEYYSQENGGGSEKCVTQFRLCNNILVL